MLLYIAITIFLVVLISLIGCGNKKPASSEPGADSKKESPGKRKRPDPSEGAVDGKSAKSGNAKKKSSEKTKPQAPKQDQPAALPDAGGDDVGYESCPDMTPEELAKVVGAPK
ncbi:hypothetical protein DICVIV_12485 [Dictyocaulus viviparus]|uniref:Uncharacterized protein n=1 Tax=Dictyocaulus viviparus TaxID=29172 RepID=A0A0D8XD01_DICVI|nr:hypothetical protein DICVIV_12485 [Dictyocaulus viviparus]